MLNVEDAWKTRRAIVCLMQKSQRKEALALNKMGDMALGAKQQILELLSDWLLTVKRAHQSDVQEIRKFTSISYEEWIELQATAEKIQGELTATREQEKISSSAYYSVATFGHASKLFSTPEKKSQIKDLEYKATAARQQREYIERKLKENTVSQQNIGETFLRDCICSLEALSTTQTLGAKVTTVLDSMTEQVNIVWNDHVNEQKELLDEVATATSTLIGAYGSPHGLLESINKTQRPEPSVKGKVSDAGDSVKNKANDATESVKSTASNIGSKASDNIASVENSAQDAVDRGKSLNR